MIKDLYKNFKELKIIESENFQTYFRNLNSKVSIIAIHGGEIEPLTSTLMYRIAEYDFNFYTLLGDKGVGLDEDLHITSKHFDDEDCIDIVKDTNITLSIHGCADKNEVIYLGGLDNDLCLFLQENIINDYNYNAIVVDNGHKFSAKSIDNIANKNSRKMGCQMELSQGFRKKFYTNLTRNRELINDEFFKFATSLHTYLLRFEKQLNVGEKIENL